MQLTDPIDLPIQISKYENVLKYARSKVDYSYGVGLYMSPSDMILQIGTVVGYNNEIVIATENQKLGFNSDVNVKPVEPTTQPTTIEGTPTKKQPEPKTITPKPKTITPEPKTIIPKPKPIIPKPIIPKPIIQDSQTKDQPEPQTINEAEQHEDNKTALIVGSIVIGIVALTYL